MKKQTEAEMWRAMYLTLFDGITKALEKLPVTAENGAACELLVKASQDAEKCYMESGEGPRDY